MRDAGSLDLEVAMVAEVDLQEMPALAYPQLVELARAVLDAETESGSWEIAFVLVDDDHLQELHRQFMGIDEPTDVMTFERTAEDGEPGRPTRGGDVIISVDRAIDQAAAHGNTASEEVRFLAVHGLLHLTGWVDYSDEERAAMLARGETILRRLDDGGA